MESFRLERSENPHTKAFVIGAVIMAVLILAWTQNIFDNFLWRVGLNHSTCVQNAFGATFCGDQAKQYERQFGNP